MDSITFLPVPDLVSVRRFYEETVGLELVLDQGTCLIFRAGGGYWGFCQSDGAVQPSQAVMLTLVTEDVEKFYESLTLRGAQTDGPPRLNERFQIFHFFVDDPSGYRLEVQRFLDRNWNSIDRAGG